MGLPPQEIRVSWNWWYWAKTVTTTTTTIHRHFLRWVLSLEELSSATVEPHLIFLLKKNLQDLLCEKEKIKTPKHHGRLGDIIIFQRVETKSLWTQEKKMSFKEKKHLYWSPSLLVLSLNYFLDSRKGEAYWSNSAIYPSSFQQKSSPWCFPDVTTLHLPGSSQAYLLMQTTDHL